MTNTPPHETIYDQVHYHDEPIRLTNLSTLHAVGKLFGLEAPHPHNARVLELGCARGTNIISLAALYPESTFVGIDLSETQIAVGTARIKAHGLTNIELRHYSILDIERSFGEFDYIIAHGVYSWVSAEVREKIFEIISTNLSPSGIGYLSYNTYPGWHIRDPLRFYMLNAGKDKDTLEEKAQAAREVLSFLHRCTEVETSPIAQCYRGEIAQMLAMPNWYYLHDFIAEHCQPFYFVEVEEQAKKVGLQYLGDAEVASMLPGNLPPKIQGALKENALDEIKVEHLMDFFTNRMFRRTLVCHGDRTISRKVFTSNLNEAFLATQLAPSAPLAEGQSVRFNHPNGGALEASDPHLQRVIAAMNDRWPGTIPLSELLKQEDCTIESQRGRAICEQIIRCIFANLIDISFVTTTCIGALQYKPKASHFIRQCIAHGFTPSNLRHEPLQLDTLDKVIIPLLDGTRTAATVFESLHQVKLSTLQVAPLSTPGDLEDYLKNLAKKAIFEAYSL